MDKATKELIRKLWQAANTHAVVVCGEALTDEPLLPDGNYGMPDPAEAIRIVIRYLEGSI
jgi:hypothetical protein